MAGLPRRSKRALVAYALATLAACTRDPTPEDTDSTAGTAATTTADTTTACQDVPWYRDGDGDSFGAGAPLLACAKPPGFSAEDGDCDDAEPAASPAAVEVCDGLDNDCDGLRDEFSAENPLCHGCALFEREGGRAYAFCLTEPSLAQPWDSAREFCQSTFGADLASIADSLEQGFIETHLIGLATTATFWIGLNDLEVEGEYQWSDGTPFVYSRWGLSQPDQAGPTEDCVELLAAPNAFGLWNDIYCAKPNYPLCEAAPPL